MATKTTKTPPVLERLLEFQHLLLAFRAVERRVHIPPGIDIFENDAEHSYILAMTAWFLAPYFPRLDQAKLIRLSLAHDILEVHAGDTYTYSDEATLRNKAVREAAAVEQLRGEWRDFPELLEAIDEYEACQTEEAKFIYALDKMTPAFLDYINEGRGWHDRGISFEVFCTEKNSKVPLSPEINAYYQELIKVLEGKRHLFPTP